MSKHYFIDCSGQAHDWLYVSKDGGKPFKVTADQASAAPDMLEALELAYKHFDQPDAPGFLFCKVRDAIAKARGKS